MDELQRRVAALEKRADKNDLAAAMRGMLDWAIATARDDLVRVDDVQAATTGRAAAHEAALAALLAWAPDWQRVEAELLRRVAELTDDSLRYERPERWLSEYCRGVREAAAALVKALQARTASGGGAVR